MKNNIILILLGIFFASQLTSCKKDVEVKIHSDFKSYVENFKTEGSSRGVSIEFTNGLIVEYAENLSIENSVAICNYGEPHRIKILRKFWSKANENDREIVLFHELGHCYLDRIHNNDKLPNDEWRSIMCETPTTINIKNYKRTYYLDELFNENTSSPDWGI